MNPNLLLLVAGAAEEAQRARLMNARREVYADFIDKICRVARARYRTASRASGTR